jgi:hypothetical protein
MSLSSAPLNNPVILKQAMHFMDQLDIEQPTEGTSPEQWEGRPEQWCALLEKMYQEQGRAMVPDVIARVVHAAQPVSRVPVRSTSGAFDLVGVDTPYEEHPEVPGWEWPPETPVHQPTPAMTWETFAEARRPVVRKDMEENTHVSALLCGFLATFVALFAAEVVAPRLSFVGYIGSVIGAGVLAFVLPLFVGGFQRDVRVERAVRRQWETYGQWKDPSQDHPAEHAQWMKVPHVAAYAHKVSPVSGQGWRREDVQALHSLLVEEERRRTRNLHRLRQHQTHPSEH